MKRSYGQVHINTKICTHNLYYQDRFHFTYGCGLGSYISTREISFDEKSKDSDSLTTRKKGAETV